MWLPGHIPSVLLPRLISPLYLARTSLQKGKKTKKKLHSVLRGDPEPSFVFPSLPSPNRVTRGGGGRTFNRQGNTICTFAVTLHGRWHTAHTHTRKNSSQPTVLFMPSTKENSNHALNRSTPGVMRARWSKNKTLQAQKWQQDNYLWCGLRGLGLCFRLRRRGFLLCPPSLCGLPV